MHLICETHIGLTIVQAIRGLAGFSASPTTVYGLPDNAGDRLLINKSTEHHAVLLTWDSATIDHVLYPICTHSGVLKLRFRLRSPSHVIPYLTRFLRTHHRKCVHAIVVLYENHAEVRGRNTKPDEPPTRLEY